MKLGKDNYELYPEEIQIKLRACWEQVQDGNSQNCEYDMTGGWLFNIRLFDDDEKPEWDEILTKMMGEDDGYVGAQWDMNKAKKDPPTSCEKGVQHRPVFVNVKKTRSRSRSSSSK